MGTNGRLLQGTLPRGLGCKEDWRMQAEMLILGTMPNIVGHRFGIALSGGGVHHEVCGILWARRGTTVTEDWAMAEP